MSHIIRSNADKIINTIPELFIKKNIVFNFVYFSSAQTLVNKCVYNLHLLTCKQTRLKCKSCACVKLVVKKEVKKLKMEKSWC